MTFRVHSELLREGGTNRDTSVEPCVGDYHIRYCLSSEN